jgi:hypothetical protein
MKKIIFFVFVLSILITGCTSQSIAHNQAERDAQDAEYYIPTRGIERRNYNWRMELADDPTTILWCTSAFSTPGSPIFTVPIIGKLTSGGKRPFRQYASSGYENVGADGMFGSSGEYRYGFGPSGMYEYYDFYDIETFCTTMPTVWQREETVIVFEKDPVLMEASEKAQQALRSGDTNLAEEILMQAIKEIKGD